MAGNTSDEILDKMPEWFRILRDAIKDKGKDDNKRLEDKISPGGAVDGECISERKRE